MIYKDFVNFYSEGPFYTISKTGKLRASHHEDLESYILSIVDIEEEYFKLVAEKDVIKLSYNTVINTSNPIWLRKLRHTNKPEYLIAYFDIELIESTHHILELEMELQE